MNIDIIVFDGHDELDVFGPYEVLRSAEARGANVHPRLVIREPQTSVTAACGTQYTPSGVYEPGSAELLLVPGGGWSARAERGAWGEVQRGDWPPLLRDAAEAGVIMASVCTGAMLLAHAGVIGSKRATTHHAAWEDLIATGATLVKERVVDAGTLITCGGVTSGIDLGLWIVEKYASREIADAIAANLEYTNRARPHDVGPLPVAPPSTAQTEEQIQAARIGGAQPLPGGRIVLVEYDTAWPELFEREASRVRAVLGDAVRLLEHVGSTSIPGLMAKPIVDMLLVVPDSSDESAYVPPMERAGYVLRIREPDWHEHRMFKGPDTNINLHVFSEGCPEIGRMLLFRDWLRSNAEARELYARTKRELAQQTWKYTQNYADAKTGVVEQILARAQRP